MAEVRTDFIPLLPLNNGVVLPNMVVTIPLEREEAQAAVAAARQGDGLVLLVPRVEGRFANFGTVAKLEDSRKLPNGIEVAILQGLYRASVGSAAAGTGTALRVLAQRAQGRDPGHARRRATSPEADWLDPRDPRRRLPQGQDPQRGAGGHGEAAARVPPPPADGSHQERTRRVRRRRRRRVSQEDRRLRHARSRS